jgi:predicted transcriptional regulator
MEWKEAKKIISSNPEVALELQKNELEYQLISEVIKARIEKNITQKDLATLIGTKQSNISRFENGNANPSIEFLKKIADALDKTIEIHLV